MLAGGGPKRVAAQHEKGKMTARERIEMLLDPGTFMERMRLSNTGRPSSGVDKIDAPGEGVVTGYGLVNGRKSASLPRISRYRWKFGEMHAAKICKVMDLAVKIGVPSSDQRLGGARIQEGVDALSGMAKFFTATRSRRVLFLRFQ